MGTPTYTPITSQTLTSSASSVTFSSIPQTYRDLVLVCDVTRATTASSSDWYRVRFNSDTGNNYNMVDMVGASTATSGSIANTNLIWGSYNFAGMWDGQKSNLIMHIFDFSATDKHKSVLQRINAFASSASNYNTSAQAARWASTSAITSIEVAGYYAQNFNAGSTFSLYGIAA